MPTFAERVAELEAQRRAEQEVPRPVSTLPLPQDYSTLPVPQGTLRDADTLDRTTGEANRAYGINAPELKNAQKELIPEGQTAYARAAEKFRANPDTKPVRYGEDYYGRTVADEVTPDGRSLYGEMVREGIARPKNYNNAPQIPFAAEARQNYNDNYVPSPEERAMAYAEGRKVSTGIPEPVAFDPQYRTAGKTVSSAIERGFESAKAGYFGTLSATGNLLSRTLPGGKDPRTLADDDPKLTLQDRLTNWMQRTGEQGYMEHTAKAAAIPKGASLQDAINRGTASGWVTFGLEAMGEAFPSIVEMVGIGAATALTGGAAGAGLGGLALRGAAGAGAKAVAERMGERAFVNAARKKLIAQGLVPEAAQAQAKTLLADLPAHLARTAQLRKAMTEDFAWKGFTTGMFGSSAAMQAGQDYEELKNETGIRAPGASLLAGGLQGALDVAGFEFVLGHFLGKGIPINKARDILKPIMQGALIGIAGEGMTEAAQEVIGVFNTEYHRPSDIPLADRMLSKENLWRYAEAGAAGAIFGGGFGSIGGAAQGGVGYATRARPATETPGTETPTTETPTTETPGTEIPPLPEDDATGQDPRIPPLPEDDATGQDTRIPPLPEDDATGQDPRIPPLPEDAATGQDTRIPPLPEDAATGQDTRIPPLPEDDATGQDTRIPPLPEDAATGQDTRIPPLPEDAATGQDTRIPPVPEAKADEPLPNAAPPADLAPPPVAEPAVPKWQEPSEDLSRKNGFVFDSLKEAQAVSDTLSAAGLKNLSTTTENGRIAITHSPAPLNTDENPDSETIRQDVLIAVQKAADYVGSAGQVRALMGKATSKGILVGNDGVTRNVPKLLPGPSSYGSLNEAYKVATEDNKLQPGQFAFSQLKDGRYQVADISAVKPVKRPTVSPPKVEIPRRARRAAPAAVAPTPAAQSTTAPAGVHLAAAMRKNAPENLRDLWEKDAAKAEQATQFIGIGDRDSSTVKYFNEASKLRIANTGKYSADDTVFVSVSGRGRTAVFDESGKLIEDGIYAPIYRNLAKATQAGATILTDKAGTERGQRNSVHNGVGEARLAQYLTNNGYQETNGNGVWKPTAAAAPTAAPTAEQEALWEQQLRGEAPAASAAAPTTATPTTAAAPSAPITEYLSPDELEAQGEVVSSTVETAAPTAAVAPSTHNLPTNYTSGGTYDGVAHNMSEAVTSKIKDPKHRTAFSAVLAGLRTASTRNGSFAKVKKGDVLVIPHAMGPLKVRATTDAVPISSVDSDTWSKGEGWEPSLFDHYKGKKGWVWLQYAYDPALNTDKMNEFHVRLTQPAVTQSKSANPEVAGINIFSGSNDPLGAALTNPTHYNPRGGSSASKGKLVGKYKALDAGIEYQGKRYKDVEDAYFALKDSAKGKSALLTDLIKTKLEQYPFLVEDINSRGGRAFLEASVHDYQNRAAKDIKPGSISEYWTTAGQNGFIKALLSAYDIVTRTQPAVTQSKPISPEAAKEAIKPPVTAPVVTSPGAAKEVAPVSKLTPDGKKPAESPHKSVPSLIYQELKLKAHLSSDSLVRNMALRELDAFMRKHSLSEEQVNKYAADIGVPPVFPVEPGLSSKRSGSGHTVASFTQELHKVLGKTVANKLLSRPNVTVLATTTDVPFSVAPDTAGLYLPDGRVFFFTENIGTGEAFGKLIHELGAHYGLQRMVGKDTYDAILARLQEMVKAEGFESVKAAHARAVNALGDAHHPSVWHETLAYLAEASPKHGLIRRLVTAIKRFLLSLGYPAGRLSDTDLVGLIQVAAFKEGSKNEGLMEKPLSSEDNQYREAQRQIAEIVPVRNKDGKLLAPNGKVSNLNERQWRLVRTELFKEWFGDWENDSANASKVTDKNGEPLVVYHGTGVDIESFFTGHLGELTGSESAKKGFFFSDNPKTAEFYTRMSTDKEYRDTHDEDTEGDYTVTNYKADLKEINSKEFTSLKVRTFNKDGSESVAIPMSVLLNSVDNGTLSSESTVSYGPYLYEINTDNLGKPDSVTVTSNLYPDFTEPLRRSSDLVALVEKLNKEFRSAAQQAIKQDNERLVNQKAPTIFPIFLNIRNPRFKDFEGSSFRPVTFSDLMDQAIRNKNDGVMFWNAQDPNPVSDVFAAFKPNQIKSAVGNRGTFSRTDDRILRSTNLIPVYQAISTLWSKIAAQDENFQHGKSTAKDISALSAAMTRGQITGHVVQDPEAGKIIELRHADGGVFRIGNVDSTSPMFDAEKVKGHGAAMYQVALAWVHNNGLRVADPGYLTPINQARQTSQFLSSALRFNTTKHLTLTESQGITDWQDGNDEHNIALMALKELEWVNQSHPALSAVQYDATKDRFIYIGDPVDIRIDDGEGHSFNQRLTTGAALNEHRIAGLVKLSRDAGRGRELGTGTTTIKRAAITRSALEAYHGRGSLGLADRSFSGDGLTLKGILYSKRTDPATEDSQPQVVEYAYSRAADGTITKRWGVQDGDVWYASALQTREEAETALARLPQKVRPTSKTVAVPARQQEAKPETSETKARRLAANAESIDRLRQAARANQEAAEPTAKRVAPKSDFALPSLREGRLGKLADQVAKQTPHRRRVLVERTLSRYPRVGALLDQIQRIINAELSPTQRDAALERLYQDQPAQIDFLRALTSFYVGEDLSLAEHFEALVTEFMPEPESNLLDALGPASDAYTAAVRLGLEPKPGENLGLQTENPELHTEVLFVGQYFTDLLAEELLPTINAKKLSEKESIAAFAQREQIRNERLAGVEDTQELTLEDQLMSLRREAALSPGRRASFYLGDAETFALNSNNLAGLTSAGRQLMAYIRKKEAARETLGKENPEGLKAKDKITSNENRFLKMVRELKASHDAYNRPWGELQVTYNADTQQYAIEEVFFSPINHEGASYTTVTDRKTGEVITLQDYVNRFLKNAANRWRKPTDPTDTENIERWAVNNIALVPVKELLTPKQIVAYEALLDSQADELARLTGKPLKARAEKLTRVEIARNRDEVVIPEKSKRIFIRASTLTRLGWQLSNAHNMEFTNEYDAFQYAQQVLLEETGLVVENRHNELDRKNISGKKDVLITYADARSKFAEIKSKQFAGVDEDAELPTKRENVWEKAEETAHLVQSVLTQEFANQRSKGLKTRPALAKALEALGKEISAKDFGFVRRTMQAAVSRWDTQLRDPTTGNTNDSALADALIDFINDYSKGQLEKINVVLKERAYKDDLAHQYDTALNDITDPHERQAALNQEQSRADKERQKRVVSFDVLGETSTAVTGEENLPPPPSGVSEAGNPKTPSAAHKLVSAVVEALGLQALNIKLFSSKDLEAYEAALSQKSPMTWLDFANKKVSGLPPASVAFIDGRVLIYYDAALNKAPVQLADALSHELGHVVFRSLLNQERERNTEVWQQLLRDYVTSGSQERFMEWFADETAKWARAHGKSVTGRDSFMTQVVAAIKALMKALGFTAGKGAVSAYLDGLARREQAKGVALTLAELGGEATSADMLTFQLSALSRATPLLRPGVSRIDFLTLDGIKRGTITQYQRALNAVPMLARLDHGARGIYKFAEDALSSMNAWLREQDLPELNLLADKLDNQARAARTVKLLSNDEIYDALHNDPRFRDDLAKAPNSRFMTDLLARADALRKMDGVEGVQIVTWVHSATGGRRAEAVPVHRASFNETVRRLYDGQWGAGPEGFRHLIHKKTEAEARQWGEELLRNDPKSEGAKAIRAWLDTFYNEYVVPGYTGPHSKAEGKPVVHIGRLEDWGLARYYNKDAVERNYDAFIKILTTDYHNADGSLRWKKMSFPDASVLAAGIVTGREAVPQTATEELLINPTFSPGAESKKAREIDIPIDQLLPFLETRVDKIMESYVHSMIKRVEWDKRFGEEVQYVDNEGKARWTWQQNYHLDNIKQGILYNNLAVKTQRLKYILDKTNKVIEAYLGRYGAFVDPRARQLISWTQVATNYLVMPLSLLSQPPDMIGPLTRMGGNSKAYFKGFREAAREIFKQNGDVWRVAEALGVIYRDTKNLGASALFDQQFLTEGAQKANDFLFKINGMQLFTNFSRLVSFQTSKYWLESLVEHKDGARLLKQVGLTQQDVIDWVQDGYKDYQSSDGENSVPFKVMLARIRFVNESVFSPHAGQRPLFANHPYAALVWHLKSFAYSFFVQLLKPALREVRDNPALFGKMMAILPMALMFPLAMLGMGLRDEIKQGLGRDGDRLSFDKDSDGFLSEFGKVLSRTGILGPIQLLLDADRASSWGRSFSFSLAGASVSKIEELFLADGGLDAAMRLTPGLAMLPAERMAIRNWWNSE